jgi:NitT/TauT family transport system substrate-binding protein
MRPAFRKGLFVAVAVVAVAILTACSSASSSTASSRATSSSSASSSSKLEKTHLTVAYLKIIQAAPLFIAIKQGFFAQQGLTVTPVAAAASTAAVAGMEHGSIDVVAAANYVNFFQLDAAGVGVKLLAPAANCNPGSGEILALKGSGITSPASLAGKSVAVQINPNIQTLTLNADLAADNVNYKTIKYVAITFPNMIAALEAHQVDAISEVEPFISEAKSKYGAVDVMTDCQGPTADLPQAGYIATAAWAAKYPNTALAFAKAIDEAQALATSDPSAVVSVLPSYIPITPTVAAHVDLGIFPSSFDPSSLQTLVNMMVSAGLLKSSINVTPLLLSGSS